jgi:hypothetical protein
LYEASLDPEMALKLKGLLVDFADREQISAVRMLILLGNVIAQLGLIVESSSEEAHVVPSDDPTLRSLTDIVLQFSEAAGIPPFKLVSLLGYTVVDLGAMLDMGPHQ